MATSQNQDLSFSDDVRNAETLAALLSSREVDKTYGAKQAVEKALEKVADLVARKASAQIDLIVNSEQRP